MEKFNKAMNIADEELVSEVKACFLGSLQTKGIVKDAFLKEKKFIQVEKLSYYKSMFLGLNLSFNLKLNKIALIKYFLSSSLKRILKNGESRLFLRNKALSN